MRQLGLLLKTNFIANYGINKLKNFKPFRLIVYIVVALYVIGSILMTFGMYANKTADFLSKYHLMSLMLVLFFIMAIFATFIFTIYNAKSSLFNAKDNDLLLSMPIKPRTILASRLITIVAWNLITSLFLILPALFVYVNKVDVSAMFYVVAFIIFLLLPVIPSILASLVGYIIAFFTSKSKNKNWFEIALSFIFIFGIYYVMGNGNKILSALVGNEENVMKVLKWGLYPVYLVYEVFSKNDYLSLLWYVIINIGVLLIFLLLLSKNFKRIIAKLQENRTKSNYKMHELKTSSVTKALFKKEMKRFFSSPIYVLNTAFGVALIIALAVASIFYDKNQLLSLLNLNMGAGVSVFQIVLLLVSFVTLISNTACVSISLEGSNFWILKSLPVDIKRILDSKLLLNLAVVLPITFIAIIIFKLTLGFTIFEMILLIVLASIFNILAAQFGLLVNLKVPKMDATNDTVVVKRSMSSIISVLVPMCIVFILAGMYSELMKTIDFKVFIDIIILATIILVIIERWLLNTWGVKQFNKIS